MSPACLQWPLSGMSSFLCMPSTLSPGHLCKCECIHLTPSVTCASGLPIHLALAEDAPKLQGRQLGGGRWGQQVTPGYLSHSPVSIRGLGLWGHCGHNHRGQKVQQDGAPVAPDVQLQAGGRGCPQTAAGVRWS